MSNRIEFESEEQVNDFFGEIYNTISKYNKDRIAFEDGKSLFIKESFEAVKKLGLIKKSPLRHKVEKAEEIYRNPNFQWSFVVHELYEVIQLFKEKYPDWRNV